MDAIKKVSLQKKLVSTSMLSSVVAGMIAFILLLGISVYQTMSVQDEIMDEISDMLLISDLTSVAGSGTQLDELSDEFDIQYQLQSQNQVLTHSMNYVPRQNTQQYDNEYSFEWFDGQLWRVYQTADESTQLTVIAYQPLKVRFKTFVSTLLGYAGILLFLWFLQWLIVHYAIARQFRPLKDLSEKIAEKSADDLSPIVQQSPQLLEIEPIVQQLNRLLSRLEQALVSEQRFTADASHELRSPLSAIQMRLQVLKRKFPELSSELAVVQQDVDRGTKVLENLLLLARLDPEAADQLAKARHNLKQIVDDALGTIEPGLKEKSLSLNSDLDDVDFYCNRELIFSCVRNLLDNAVRYSPERGEVSISLRALSKGAVLTVANRSPELQADLSRLGERFYRVLGTKAQGSGLGLSICKKILELHYSQLSFEASAPDSFKVRIDFSEHS
jgi:two-component system sensor histidine kinase QseC